MHVLCLIFSRINCSHRLRQCLFSLYSSLALRLPSHATADSYVSEPNLIEVATIEKKLHLLRLCFAGKEWEL
jgi:hypothetical protein